MAFLMRLSGGALCWLEIMNSTEYQLRIIDEAQDELQMLNTYI